MNLRLNCLITSLSFFILTLSFQKSFPQNSTSVDTAWVRHYIGVNNSTNQLTALAVDKSGNMYVTGSSGSPTNTDYVTIKYNTSGDEQWLVRYNGPENGNDDPTALVVDNDGNIYVTGMSEGNGTDRDYATVKYNPSGIEQWVVRYNGPNNMVDKATALAVDGEGNVYVTGGIDGNYHSVIPWLILFGNGASIKYNTAGVEQWTVMHDGAGSEKIVATALAIDDFGNVFVSGYSHQCYITSKYNFSGVKQWIAQYNCPPNGIFGVYNFAVDDGGNVYIAVLGGDGSTYEEYVTIKYNAAGADQWIAHYRGFNRPTALAIDNVGNVYVTGRSDSEELSGYATIKYNSSGDSLWNARYDCPGSADEKPTAIAVDDLGNVYVTGAIGDYGHQDCITLKYDSNGIRQWDKTYGMADNSDDRPIAIALDEFENVYVAGTSFGDGWSSYTTIKYVETTTKVSIPEPERIPDTFSLSQNHPNPFNPSTTIEFALPKSAFVTLKVYDLLGEEVATLVAENRTAGIHRLNWDARGLASGVYLYRLEVVDASTNLGQGFVQVKKLILMH